MFRKASLIYILSGYLACPSFQTCLSPHLQVREAMAALLCSMSSSRAIHFYDVVPVDMLLDVMSHDSVSETAGEVWMRSMDT